MNRMKQLNQSLKKSDKCEICKLDRCICQSFWRTFDDVMNKKAEAVNLDPSALKVSTMTVNFKFKYLNINLDKLSSQIKLTPFTREINFKKNARKSRNNPDLNFQMYNSCIIKGFVEHNSKEMLKVSMKIFNNGSFNITGCRTINSIIIVIKKLIILLLSMKDVIEKPKYIIHENCKEVIVNGNEVFSNCNISFVEKEGLELENVERLIIEDGKMFVKAKSLTIKDPSKTIIKTMNDIILMNVEIALINTDFSINKPLFQQKLFQLINNKYLLSNGGNVVACEFQPDTHHAVKIRYIPERTTETYKTRKRIEKYKGETVILVFNTGSILITGGKTTHEIHKAYEFIIKTIDDNSYILRNKKIKKVKKIRKIYIKKEILKEIKNEYIEREKTKFTNVLNELLNN